MAVISPPRLTSTTSWKPIFLRAVLQLARVISAPNCPMVAGANMAYTRFPACIALMISTINVLEPMAPNGHLWIHAPHLIHFSSFITAIPTPLSDTDMAFTGQLFIHGLISSAMAL